MNEAKKPARILVVDDEERNRRLLVAMLEATGYTALEAADGTQALEFARQNPPDLVLLDIMMPGVDGYEVARALKADAATKSIPVVMVTALDDRDSRLRGLEAGAEEFVTKPVDRNELRIRVRNLLRLKDYSDFLANHNRILETKVTERTAQLASSYRETILTMTHAAIGAKMLEESNSPYLRMGAQIARSHHERWSGGGYPDNLRGDTIPLAARFMQLADVYDALRSKRPYKPPFGHYKALEIILKGDGRTMPEHFDPAMLDAFAKSAERFNEIWDEYADR